MLDGNDARNVQGSDLIALIHKANGNNNYY